jgi:hypothetical protein
MRVIRQQSDHLPRTDDVLYYPLLLAPQKSEIIYIVMQGTMRVGR